MGDGKESPTEVDSQPRGTMRDPGDDPPVVYMTERSFTTLRART